MSSEAAPISTLSPLFISDNANWSGEGYKNGTNQRDVGIILQFSRLDSQGASVNSSSSSSSSGSTAADNKDTSTLQLIARNRVGADLNEEKSGVIRGTLELDAAALVDRGLSADEESSADPASASSFFSFKQNDQHDEFPFEVFVRGKIATPPQIIQNMIFSITIETPYGQFMARGHLPEKLLSKKSNKEEPLAAEHYAAGQWVTLAGYPCFDIQSDSDW